MNEYLLFSQKKKTKIYLSSNPSLSSSLFYLLKPPLPEMAVGGGATVVSGRHRRLRRLQPKLKTFFT
jgi:hypothetical protein